MHVLSASPEGGGRACAASRRPKDDGTCLRRLRRRGGKPSGSGQGLEPSTIPSYPPLCGTLYGVFHSLRDRSAIYGGEEVEVSLEFLWRRRTNYKPQHYKIGGALQGYP
jgi:hypothetical protein